MIRTRARAGAASPLRSRSSARRSRSSPRARRAPGSGSSTTSSTPRAAASAPPTPVAKKCKGGKLGYYKFVSIAHAEGGDTELSVEINADLPVFSQWKPLKNPQVSIQASDDFDPNVVAEIASAYGDFFDGIETKWSPGDLLFKHPALIVFGNEILSEGKHLETFKPKDKC